MEAVFVLTYVLITFILVAMALMLFRLGGKELRMWSIVFLAICVLAAGEVNSMMFADAFGPQFAGVIFDISSALFAYGFVYSIESFRKAAFTPKRK